MEHFVTDCHNRINTYLSKVLADSDQHSQQLSAAMHYVCNGGKRIRACLVYAAGALFTDTPPAILDKFACAVELIHAYSLVHDDLPAMDNDDLRRGKPTCHIAFDEATAILVGDALQALAFEVMCTEEPDISASQLLRCSHILAKASGGVGMVAGQMIDLQAVGKTLSMAQLDAMHHLKTGAIINASVILGALASQQARDEQIAALRNFGEAIGLAFQIQDDILDVESSTEKLGKTVGSDQQLNKPTYVTIMPLAQAKLRADELYQQALTQLDAFGDRAQHLRAMARLIVKRES